MESLKISIEATGPVDHIAVLKNKQWLSTVTFLYIGLIWSKFMKGFVQQSTSIGTCTVVEHELDYGRINIHI